MYEMCGDPPQGSIFFEERKEQILNVFRLYQESSLLRNIVFKNKFRQKQKTHCQKTNTHKY
jgi:hypothetical protein